MNRPKRSKAQLERNVTEEDLVAELLAKAVAQAIERRKARGLEIAVWREGSVHWIDPSGKAQA